MKYMKSITKHGMMIWMMIITVSSCSDYLNVVPENTMTIENIFNTQDEAYKALSKIYSYLPADHMTYHSTWLLGDEFIHRLDYNDRTDRLGAIRIMRGLQSATTPMLGNWGGTGGGKKYYEAIRQTNVFLDHVDGIHDMSEPEKAEWKAQATFLKAYYHFLLLQKYGPVVIADKTIAPDALASDLFQSRSKTEACFDYIIRLINEAIPDLNERTNETNLGMVDRMVALSIKARILLFRASPFYNGNKEYFGDFLDRDGQPFFAIGEYDKEKWKEALDAINEAIALCKSNGKDLYTFDGEPYVHDREAWESNNENMKTYYTLRMLICDPWNKELIWGMSNIDASEGTLAHGANIRLPYGFEWAGNVQQTTFCWNWLGASYRMAERYYTRNGVPIDEDKTFTAYIHDIVVTPGAEEAEYGNLRGILQPNHETVELYLNREPRFYANLGITGGYWRAHLALIPVNFFDNGNGGRFSSVSQTDYFPTGIGIQKLVHPESRSQYWQRVIKYPFPIIRMADLYLMKAEALNEYGGPSAEAYEAINLIRRRAGIPDVETVWSDPDIVKTVGKHTTQTGLRDIILRERGIELAFEGSRFWDMLRYRKAPAEFSGAVQGWNYAGINATNFFVLGVKQTRKFSITDCLWPIDLDEMNTNANLIQNPGW
jgi:hypothetical protein